MTPELIRAGVLGAMQGATEFLPISSSGHLVIVPALLGWPAQGLAFDSAVHMATALAAILYLRATWLSLLRSSAAALRDRRLLADESVRTLILLGIATIPAAVVGVAFHDKITLMFDSPRAAAFSLFITSGLLVVAERYGRGQKQIAELRVRGAVLIGIGQAVAIVPGVSRSGSTIAAGQLSGLYREAATRFSFLLAAPIILGAGGFELMQARVTDLDTNSWLAIGVGFATSFMVGFATIGWLLRFVARHSLLPFAAYTAAAAVVGLLILD